MAWTSQQLRESVEVYLDLCAEHARPLSLLDHLTASGWRPALSFDGRRLSEAQQMVRPLLRLYAAGCRRRGQLPVMHCTSSTPITTAATLVARLRGRLPLTEVSYDVTYRAGLYSADVYCPEGVVLSWGVSGGPPPDITPRTSNFLADQVWPGYPERTFFTVLGGHKIEKWFWERLPTVAARTTSAIKVGAPWIDSSS